MFDLILTWLPLLSGVLMMGFVGLTLRKKPEKWTGSILSVWLIGLLICILAAYRDGYGFSETSVLSFTGFTAMVFSALGLLVTLVTLGALFTRKQALKKKAFVLVALIFLVKWAAMESLRFLA